MVTLGYSLLSNVAPQRSHTLSCRR